MSPDRPPSSNECGTVIDTIDSGMVQQELIIENQPQIVDSSRQNVYYTSETLNTSATSMAAPALSSKLVILQQNPSQNSAYMKESDGKVVLVATEQMLLNYTTDKHNLNGSIHSIASNTSDEDLTSLTWLHDSNLLRGINLTCSSNNKHANITNSYTAVDGGKRHLQTRAISPTSDFLEDSCISEDNGSSANSNSDQGISIFCTETPTKLYHYSHQINNNNNSNNKNLNHSKSDALKPPSIIHLSLNKGPDHESNTSKTLKSNQLMVKTANGLMAANNIDNGADNKNGGDAFGQSTTPHQHFHKKYLREEHNKVLQQLNSETTVTCTTNRFVNDSIISTDFDMEGNTVIHQQDSQTQVTLVKASESSPNKATILNSPTSQNKQKHPQNLPYDPFVHTNNKPPLSFSSLIFLAIEDAHEKALPVKEIYSWIIQHYPYFKTAPTGWKNSVRHNLSLNKCFQKVEKAPNMGKGSLWRVEQQYKQNLIQALTRSAYHPGTIGDEKLATPVKSSTRPAETYVGLKSHGRPLDAELFPRLSKYMADMSNGNGVERTNPSVASAMEDDLPSGNDNTDIIISKDNYLTSQHVNVERMARYWGVDNIDDVNAATAMLALKHGPKIFSENFQSGSTPIITSVPSEDHTYSAGGGGNRTNGTNANTVNTVSSVDILNTVNNTSDNASNGTSSDAAYESSEESQSQMTEMDLEARRHQEGIDAFLSFATEVSSMSSPIKRPLSADSIDPTANNGTYSQYYYYYEDSSPSSTISSASSVQPFSLAQPNQPAYLSTPSPPKKSRSRNLRTKLKKKAWFH